MPQIDIITEDTRWADAELAPLAGRAFAAVFEELGLDTSFEISLLACDDARISALNETFRAKEAATNVLSWPSVDLYADTPGAAPHLPSLTDPELGDIAIAFETCQSEAHAQHKPFENHVCHLLVHGLLHLLGYDHVNEADAARMEGLERRILAKLDIPDPY